MLNYLIKNKNYLILAFTLAYISAFTANAFVAGNFEFLYYTILVVALIVVVIMLHTNLHLAFFILFNLSLLGFLHLLGGNATLNGTRLYDYYFIPHAIRYDNIIHTYATYIATITLYSLLTNFISDEIKKRYYIFAGMLILMAIGLGTINELVELFAVVVFGAQEEVGGYFNNALDLLFNTLGAMAATVVIYFYRRPPKFIKKINVPTGKNN